MLRSILEVYERDEMKYINISSKTLFETMYKEISEVPKNEFFIQWVISYVDGKDVASGNGVFREAFQKFVEEMPTKKPGMFDRSETSEYLLPSKNYRNLQDFRILGRSLAKCAITQQPVYIPLAPIVFKYIVNDIPFTYSHLSQELGHFDSQVAMTNSNLIDDNTQDLSYLDVENIFFTHENKEILLSYKMFKDLIVDRRDALDALKDGFLDIDNQWTRIVTTMLSHDKLSKTICGEPVVSPEKIIQIINFKNFEEMRAPLTAVIQQFDSKQLRHFLWFTTGSNALPESGDRTITIIKGDFRVSTCAKELILPSIFEVPKLKNFILDNMKFSETYSMVD
eukprot:TRINITY_DN2537_c0_g1_i1.p1 TRINITY_DN2537_c0_g1~~TRINITY_DN2537_c0_g1_i1.p1  ORF type:complete len:339 (-),score=48.19 TRINITY_DN2537_c0_g1_i1:15-1031(-)